MLNDLSADFSLSDSDFDCVLTQISIPKEMSDMIEGVLLTSKEGNIFDDISFVKLLSPDGLEELLISGDSEEYDLFLNDELDSDIFDLFKVGEWSVDENGMTVFTDTDGNKVSWGKGFSDLTYEGTDGTSEQFEVGYPDLGEFDGFFDLEKILDDWNELLNS